MSKKEKRNFSAEQKTKIVLELMESELTIAQLSKKYEITGKTIQNRKKQFLENASLAFEPAKVVSEYKSEIKELKAENDELAKALGKATVERDWVVGKLTAWMYQIKGILSIPSWTKYQWQDNANYSR